MRVVVEEAAASRIIAQTQCAQISLSDSAIDQPENLLYPVEEMSPLGEFEQIVLLAILRLGEEAYGVAIRSEIVDRTGRTPSPGALYATLDRLEEKGLVVSRLGDPTPQRGGRAKRFFTVTQVGTQAVQRAQRAYRSLLEGMQILGDVHG